MYLLVFAFVADFPSDAPEFYQHMRRIPDKKSSHEIVKEEGRSYADYQRM